MKEYKYKINGNVYKVAIGDIEDNIAKMSEIYANHPFQKKSYQKF